MVTLDIKHQVVPWISTAFILFSDDYFGKIDVGFLIGFNLCTVPKVHVGYPTGGEMFFFSSHNGSPRWARAA